MDTRLFDVIHQQCPHFNRAVCDGLATTHLKYVEEYVHHLFQGAEAGFPPGLRYMGYARCSPQEEYAVITAKRNNNKKSWEVTKSDLYLVKYMFTYNGEELKPRYLYLPYVTDGGIIRILGSTFSISPVLADRSVSVGVDSLFIPLYRDKLTFKRVLHHFVVDNERDTAYVVTSNIHHPSKKRVNESPVRKMVDLDATPVHYLFCKFGLTRTFAQFGNAVVKVGYDDINTTNYPVSEWRICQSTMLKPRGVKGRLYVGSKLKLAIRRDHYNLTTAGMIGAFFYILDHFPDRIEAEYVDEVSLWKVLMGYVALDANTSEGKMLVGIESHMESLDGYIDPMSKEDLLEDGVYVNDIYDLFGYVLENFSARVAQSGSSIASMYGKKLTVMRYVLRDINDSIFKLMFALKKKSKQGTKILSKKEIIDTMMKHLKPELVMMMNRNHGEVSSVSSPSDNKHFKITSNIVLQTSTMGKGGKSKAKAVLVDPSKYLDASQAEVGSFTNLPKSEPTGRSRINPYVRLGPDGSSIERDPAKVELLDSIQKNIQR